MAAESNLRRLWLVLLLVSPLLSMAQGNAYWRDQTIYQIFTDRFFDGDAANNNASSSFNASSGTGVHGGDFRGVEQKLDYIKSLGATAIWISPVILNGNGEYHGYAGRDFYSVDPHWGTRSNLQAMVAAAQARGILVIQDVVVNHGGTLNNRDGNTAFNTNGYPLSYASASRQFAFPFNTNAAMPNLTNLFHNYGAIQNYGINDQVERGELSGLDDFRTETAYIRTNMANVFTYWVTNIGFDGFRIDTVKHVEMGFWQDWCPRVRAGVTNLKPNFFMFGEVFDGSDTKCGSYTGTIGGGPFKLDSLLDFPLYYAANDVFALGTGNTGQLENRYAGLGNYDAASRDQLVTFLDNHDVPRFLDASKANNNTNRLTLGLTFLLTSRGIPCIYQGTEQAFNGGGDPNNREDMFDGAFEQGPSLGDNFNMVHPQYRHIAMLNNLRRLYPALRQGTHINQWMTPGGPGLFAYARQLGGTQEVFVAMNTATSTQSLPARTVTYPAGTTLVNLLDTNETIVVQAGSQTPTLNVPGMGAKLFIVQAQLRPLDPAVVALSPAHDATNVSALAPLTLQFTQPMDTNSVQAAFNTTPTVGGNFTWSAAQDAVTFTPTTNWPGLTLMRVRLGDAARSRDTTNRMYAAFEAQFRTATAADLVRPTLGINTPTNNATVSGALMFSGTAADNTAVTRVEVQLDDRGWQVAAGTTSWSWSWNSSNFLNGTHTLFARAFDGAGNISLTNQRTVRFFNVPGAYVQRIAGGSAVTLTNCDAALWLSDRPHTNGAFGFVDGGAGFVASTVTGVCAVAQSLYQRERFSTSPGGFSYRFDCPAGVYETTLLEAETYWTAVGQRVFNVFIEGQQVLTNFDIFVAAGGRNLPLTRVFTNTVADARLELLFTPVADNARISGVQVRKIADVYSDSDGVPDWWRLAYFDRALGSATDLSRGADDADGDGAPNWQEFLAGTDPLNPASVFAITGLDLSSGSNVLIQCLVASNRTYQLMWQESVQGGSWIAVGAPTAATNNVVRLVDPTAPTNAARFYRVRSE
jgi:glycosidase